MESIAEKRIISMKIRTRLILLFVGMSVIPIIFSFIGFYAIWSYLSHVPLHQFEIQELEDIVYRAVIKDMIIMVILILIITAFFLSNWISRSVFSKIVILNDAMKNVAKGNLDYQLPVSDNDKDCQDEFSMLYSNYEDMRLRLKESALEKIESEKQYKELVSNITHDLKTPITSIKGYVEGIMDGVANTPEKQEKYIRTIYNKANDMDKLINELTYYSGVNSNRIPYNFRKLNVCEYFTDCIEEMGMDLDSRAITLNYSCMIPPDTIVIADPEQMKKVINNITGNSIKYMDKAQGIIDIRIIDENDSICIEIEDNGRGIPARDLPKIFDRFYRTDASRNSAKGGSGIGLSIVKKIIEDHGGYIWATSKEGENTCIHFVLRKYQETINE